MDGRHDLGGKQGFGPIRYSPMAPTFHAHWEKRVNALYSLAVKLGIFNMDEYTTPSSAWSRATTCRPATTNAR